MPCTARVPARAGLKSQHGWCTASCTACTTPIGWTARRTVTAWSSPVPPLHPLARSLGPRLHASRHHWSCVCSCSSGHQDSRNRSRNTRSPSISAGAGGSTSPGPTGRSRSRSMEAHGCPVVAGTPVVPGLQPTTTNSTGQPSWDGGCCASRHGTLRMGPP